MSKQSNDWFFEKFDWTEQEPNIPGPARFMVIVIVTLIIVLTLIGVFL